MSTLGRRGSLGRHESLDPSSNRTDGDGLRKINEIDRLGAKDAVANEIVHGARSVEQPIDGRAPLRSLQRRDDLAVGPDCLLEVRAQHRGRHLRFKGSPLRDRPRSSILRHQCRSRQIPLEHARPVLGQRTTVIIYGVHSAP
jgi:hypothetical protein